MRLLVCGSRDWDDAWAITYLLDGIAQRHWPLTIIHGGAPGADRIAKTWAECFPREVDIERYPADWKRHGKAAGPIRNQRMIDEGGPDMVFAFRNNGESPGTDDMVERAKGEGIPTYVVRRA